MKIGPFTPGNLVWILGILLVLAGIAYLELTHEIATGAVLEKRERIDRHVTTAHWTRNTEVLVRYELAQGTYERWIPLDTSTYDATQTGGTLSLRYVSINPSWARLETQSTLSAIRQHVHLWQLFTWFVLAAGAIFLIRRHRQWRIDRWWLLPRSAGSRIMVLAAVILWIEIGAAGYFPPPFQGGSDGQRQGSTEAVIQEITPITQVGGGNRRSGGALPIGLPRSFERIELVFTPDGWTDPVVAVDEVNEGSAGALSTGDAVTVRYSPDNPRDARMDAGSRSHRWVNPLVVHALIGVLAGLALTAPLIARTAQGAIAEAVDRQHSG